MEAFEPQHLSARRSWHPGWTAFNVEMFEKAVASIVEAFDDDETTGV